MRSTLALLFLGVISSTSAQCASDNEDQQQLYYDVCFISAQCKDQCSQRPSNQDIGSLCQDACVCVMKICNSCCAAAGSQFERLISQSNAPLNLNMCEGPGGQGRVANDNYILYRSSFFIATTQFPPSIETFLNNVPAPTGLTFSFATCTTSDQSTPEASATVTPSQTAAGSSSASEASPGTAAASSGPSAGPSTGPAQATGSPTTTATTAASTTAKSSRGDSKTGGRVRVQSSRPQPWNLC